MNQAEAQAPAKTEPTAKHKRAKRLRKPKAGAGGKLRLVTLDHLDNRTIASRRVHETLLDRIETALVDRDNGLAHEILI
jgi:hypothetical protein